MFLTGDAPPHLDYPDSGCASPSVGVQETRPFYRHVTAEQSWFHNKT
jgi:hypothetical protein